MVNLDEYDEGTLLLKKKTLKKTKGENRGDEFDVFEGTIYIGNNKFISISAFNGDSHSFEKDGKDVEGMFVKVRPWKGDKPSTKKKKQKGWK